MNIDNQCSFLTSKGIKLIEDRYKCKYVFESPLMRQDGNWTNEPAAIFYTKKKHPVSKSNYLAIFKQREGFILCNGQSAVTKPIIGLTDGYNVVYSRHVHDYRQLGNCAIDGGRDYVKVVGNNPKTVEIIVKKDKLVIEE